MRGSSFGMDGWAESCPWKITLYELLIFKKAMKMQHL